jgi:hypothetical protein
MVVGGGLEEKGGIEAKNLESQNSLYVTSFFQSHLLNEVVKVVLGA